MKMLKFSSRNGLMYLFAIVLWLIFVSPSFIQAIYSSGWFYCDAPSIAILSQELSGFKWLSPVTTTGRYVPFYLIYHILTGKLLGVEIFNFFLIQSIVILLSTFLIVKIIFRFTSNKLISTIGLLLYYTSSSFAENIYTVGKPEHLVLFFILLLIELYFKIIETNNNIRMIIYTVCGVFATIFAIWSKETAIVIAAFSIFCFIFSFKNKYIFKKTFWYLICISLSVLMARIPYYFNEGSKETYTTYEISVKLVKDNFIYYMKNQPDAFILGALCLIIICYLGVRKEKNNVLVLGLLLLSWSYIAGLLLWRWSLGYYFYVSSALFCLIISVLLSRVRNKKLLIFLGVIIIFTRFASIPYNIYIANSQLTIDRLYSNIIKNYVNLADNNQRLLFENWTFFDEAVYQSNILVKDIYIKPNLSVDGLSDIFIPDKITPEIKKLYDFNVIPEANERMPKKGDFVAVFTGNKSAFWNLRGVAPYINDRSILKDQGYNLELIGKEEISSKELFYERFASTPVYKKTYLGYELYRVKDDSIVIWDGRYIDNWIGRYARLKITDYDKNEINLKIDSLSYNLPNKIKIKDNGVTIFEINIENPGSFISKIELPKNHTSHNIDFEVEKVFIPKQVGINNDDRNLGVQLILIN